MRIAIPLVGLAGLLSLLSGCATPQIHATSQTYTSSLKSGAFRDGIAFVTPSTVTGQEEDRQALALAFAKVLHDQQPEVKSVPLPETLSAINRAGLTGKYKAMCEDYRQTGIFDRDALQDVAKVAGVRYVAQLKLAGFKQGSKGRWGALGFRVLETQLSDIRLFLQIWDSQDGSIAWEGVEELSYAKETLAEDTVTFKTAVEETARRLIARLP
jgi:hypothetical protein